jgi:hypothetical protein
MLRVFARTVRYSECVAIRNRVHHALDVHGWAQFAAEPAQLLVAAREMGPIREYSRRRHPPTLLLDHNGVDNTYDPDEFNSFFVGGYANGNTEPSEPRVGVEYVTPEIKALLGRHEARFGEL